MQRGRRTHSHIVRTPGGLSMGYLTNKPKVIVLEKSGALASGYAGVYLWATDKAALSKKRFSVNDKRGGEPVVAGRFATAPEAALRRHIALKELGA